MSIFVEGKSKLAYRGKLTCPVCKSEANRLIEWLTPFRARYKCRKCGLTYQYDISGAPAPYNHPYAPFKKPRFQELVDAHWEKLKRRGIAKL